MVNNNGIPIEVKKPFDTVYEIKNETPSFEEFMKDYKADENLNYDDLSGGSVGKVEGYGPCQICDKGPQRWKYLYMACPGVNENNVPCGNPNKTFWYHSSDDGKGEISNRANIRCSDCKTTAHMSYWSFRCSWHKGEKQYWNTTKLRFKEIINQLNCAESYIGSEMAEDILTYITHPQHRNEGRIGWSNNN